MRAYEIASAMCELLCDLHNVKRKEEEKEEQYRKHLNEAIFRCGIREETLHADVLSSIINMVVAHHRESINHRDLNFESLCYFTKSKDEAYCARPGRITTKINNQQYESCLTKTQGVVVGIHRYQNVPSTPNR